MKQNKVCLIYNFAQHYRKNIFLLMEKELNCDFVFGDKYLDIKKIDYSLFSKKPFEVKNINIGPFIWQHNVVKYIFKDYKKYIVLGQPYDISTWVLLIFAKLLRKKVYLWSHGWYGRENSIKKYIKKVFFGLAEGVLLYGDYARNLMIKNGFNPNKLFVIYNSLDYDNQLIIRKQLKESYIYKEHFGNDFPVLLFVGRLTKVKRLDLLVEIINMSIKNNKPLNLIFIGKGEQEEVLKKIVNSLALDSYIWFYGACYDEIELSKLIYNADICVAPGNVGLTAIHSLSYGCPVITHDNYKEQMPEFEAIKKGVTGDFYEQNNIQSLYDVIHAWLLHHNRNDSRIIAYDEVDSKWNPHKQITILKQILS